MVAKPAIRPTKNAPVTLMNRVAQGSYNADCLLSLVRVILMSVGELRKRDTQRQRMEAMSQSSLHALIWSEAQQYYELHTHGQPEIEQQYRKTF